MKKINLGHVELISDPAMQRLAAPVHSQPANSPAIIIAQSGSISELQKTTGFKVFQPRWLPAAGFKLTQVSQMILTSASSRRPIGSILKYREEETRWLVLRQMLIQEIGRIKIPFEAWEGKVGTQPAAFYKESVPASKYPSGRISVMYALWEHADCLMELHGYAVPEDQMAQLGESLG